MFIRNVFLLHQYNVGHVELTSRHGDLYSFNVIVYIPCIVIFILGNGK